MRQIIVKSLLSAALAISGGTAIAAQHEGHVMASDALKSAVTSPTRKAANTARDAYRHPVETLAFFGVKPSDTVVEIWPGGGWYTEILAPYLASGGGTLYAAAPDSGLGGTKKLMEANPALYGAIKTATFPIFDGAGTPVPAGSADAVLTFRNVHNWRMGYQRDGQEYGAEAFRQIFAMLKPGGTLGIVDHRLPEEADAAREKSSGYIKTSTIRRLAEEAGFKFVGESSINANPKDTADHEKGVWTLPPTFAMKDVDREKYAAIGESDRMTLKFVKP